MNWYYIQYCIENLCEIHHLAWSERVISWPQMFSFGWRTGRCPRDALGSAARPILSNTMGRVLVMEFHARVHAVAPNGL
jgi:hypothetical protein